MVAIFCTNSINILAGVNGLEVGQSFVIALSIVLHNCLQILFLLKDASVSAAEAENHLFSLFLIIPFLGVSAGLLFYNWSPADVFVGDTFCYFAGMTFAVVGILGHFSKTLLLFFLPQIFNFLLSVPQLFGMLPCPRHRMPTLSKKPSSNNEPSLLYGSEFVVEIDSNQQSLIYHSPDGFNAATKTVVYNYKFGMAFINLFVLLRLVSKRPTEKERIYAISNFTLINTVLVNFGEMEEESLALCLISLQIISNLLAFFIRYGISSYLF